MPLYCRKCGTQHDDNAFKCVSCGYVMQPQAAPRIENYLVLAIIATLCCCLPPGIVSIVFAAQVNPKAQIGDIAGAQESARKARMWALIGIGLGLLVYVFYVLAIVASEELK